MPTPGGKPSIGSAPESLPPEGVFRPRLRVGDDEGHLAPARTPLGPEVCTCCKERPQLEDVLLLVCIPARNWATGPPSRVARGPLSNAGRKVPQACGALTLGCAPRELPRTIAG